MQLPPPRGPLSGWLSHRLLERETVAPRVEALADPCTDDDLQLALWVAYELDTAGSTMWIPTSNGIRLHRVPLPSGAALDGLVGSELRGRSGPATGRGPVAVHGRDRGRSALRAVPASACDEGTVPRFLLNRSVYQLKEADPHSFGIARLDGATKAALVEIEADEYGGGRPERMHSELFRTTMRWLGLDDGYGHYVPAVPAVTLAVSNVMSLFAIHRRWTGALLGHLAALEMTSTLPNRQYATGAIRLGASEEQARYFTEHVEADAVHEQVAAHDLCGNYVRQHPAAIGDVLFGARCALRVDDLFARHLLNRWSTDQRDTSRYQTLS